MQQQVKPFLYQLFTFIQEVLANFQCKKQNFWVHEIEKWSNLSLGARVIGTVSTEEKAKLVKELGCDEVIIYTQKDFVEETLRLTNGNGYIFSFFSSLTTRVQAVYDSVMKRSP